MHHRYIQSIHCDYNLKCLKYCLWYHGIYAERRHSVYWLKWNMAWGSGPETNVAQGEAKCYSTTTYISINEWCIYFVQCTSLTGLLCDIWKMLILNRTGYIIIVGLSLLLALICGLLLKNKQSDRSFCCQPTLLCVSLWFAINGILPLLCCLLIQFYIGTGMTVLASYQDYACSYSNWMNLCLTTRISNIDVAWACLQHCVYLDVSK